jgi:type I restriction enzyme, S subunit
MNNRTLKPGWKIWRFEQMAQNVNERIDRPVESGLERYVGLEHLDTGSLKIWRWGSTSDVEKQKLLFKKGDIIFGRRNAYLRRVAVADFDGVCSAHALVLRAKEVVLPGFLPFFMQTDQFWEAALKVSAGSMSPTINWPNIAKEEFALPSLAEQERVTNLLKSVEHCIDSTVVAADKIRLLRLSLAQDFFSSKNGILTPYGQIPTSWKFIPVKEVTLDSSFGPRFSASLYNEKGNVKTIRTTDFANHGLICYESVPTAEIDPEMASKHRLVDGDFLLSRSGEYAGMVRVFREPKDTDLLYIPAAFLIRFRLDQHRILPDFLFELFESPQGILIIRSLARGSAQPNISGTTFLNLKIPIPPIETQKQIVRRLKDTRLCEQAIEQRKLHNQDIFSKVIQNFLSR